MQKIRKFLFVSSAIMASMLSGCMNNEPISNKDKAPYDFNKFKQTEVLSVNVPTGKAAVVTFGSDTLYVLTKSEDVMIPYVKNVEESRAGSATNPVNSIVVTYTDAKEISNLAYSSWGDILQTIAFEDSPNGDYDYNDLVLHVRIGKNNSQSLGGISIQPIALGSTKTLGLGAYVKDSAGNEYKIVLSNDVRADYFDGREGFINTYGKYGTGIKFWYLYKLFTEGMLTNNLVKVNWFLIDGNKELFAVTDDYYSKSLDAKGRPYGLVFTNIGPLYSVRYSNGTKRGGSYGTEFFWYPSEQVSIEQAYPMFSQLFDASSNVSFSDVFGTRNSGYCYNAQLLLDNSANTDYAQYEYYYDNDDARNLYFIRPNTGYFYYNNGGEKSLVSFDRL